MGFQSAWTVTYVSNYLYQYYVFMYSLWGGSDMIIILSIVIVSIFTPIGIFWKFDMFYKYVFKFGFYIYKCYELCTLENHKHIIFYRFRASCISLKCHMRCILQQKCLTIKNPLKLYLGDPLSDLWRLGCPHEMFFTSNFDVHQKRVLLLKNRHSR